MDGVILAMPGPWADNNYEAADIYTTKIGGTPDWPFPIDEEKQSLLECNTCGINLSLLAQIYAPVSSESLAINERIIYVFGCLLPYCESHLWRAVRVQKIPSNEKNHVPSSSVSVANDNWQEDLWSFDTRNELGHENSGDDDDDDNMDMEELARALSEAASFTTTDRKKQNNDVGSNREPLPRGRLARPIDDKIPVMPCFYVYPQEEKVSKKVTNESSKASLLSVQEFDHISEDQSNGEPYEEEKYEYDSALSADRTYLKFKKRMDSYPEQCFRYSYGGKPLLASVEMENPEMCKHFIFFLHEAANERQRTSLEKFNWMTLLVYTCSKSCTDSLYKVKSGDVDWIIAEEAVIVQYE
ncbi:programmed cell death protein 2-like protein [Striga asiatica]|uniref:Programmed cell death protein 2-like protein n=1 Tax=Striga asiatica TaxID=4170 RepID=A0A5A7QRS5_STRAF|nr:programmed cell death protein 2-like protein [Striga asiatica]